MGNWQFRAGVLASAILAGVALSSSAMAQAGGSGGSSEDTGCDGDQQKGVIVSCAGIEFCTCADHCSTNSDCKSDCCQDSICLPACVCDGHGYSECKVGEYPSDARASESGGCSTPRVTGAPADAGSWLAIGIVAGLLACNRRSGAKGGQRRARS